MFFGQSGNQCEQASNTQQGAVERGRLLLYIALKLSFWQLENVTVTVITVSHRRSGYIFVLVGSSFLFSGLVLLTFN